MEIKKNITVQERVDFVNFVVASCEVENRHVPALFDYAWRAAVVKFFVPEAWDKIGDDQDMTMRCMSWIRACRHFRAM